MKKRIYVLAALFLALATSAFPLGVNPSVNAAEMTSDGYSRSQQREMTQPSGMGEMFMASLSGAEEVPAVSTSAAGRAVFRYDRSMALLEFTIEADRISNISQAHIHLGMRGQNGPVVAWLYPQMTRQPSEIPGMTSGIISRGVITEADLVGLMDGMTVADLVEQIQAGNAYVNVHTTRNQQGEIRGQLRQTNMMEAQQEMEMKNQMMQPQMPNMMEM